MEPNSETALIPGRVSVVIPVHNGLPHIRQALESALNQDYPDLEVLVVNNSSDDGTNEYLAGLTDPRVRILDQPQFVQVDQNFTDAVAAASGEFVRLLCADDFLHPGAVRAHVAAFEQYPDAVLVGSRRDICDDRGTTIIKGRGLDGLRTVNSRAEVVAACVANGTNVIGEPFARTHPLRAELPFNPDLRFVLDIDLYIKALRHGGLVTIPGVYSAFRVGASSYSASAAGNQAEQFTQWIEQLRDDESLHLTSEDVRVARKRARSNQRGRSAFYRYLSVREKLRRLKG